MMREARSIGESLLEESRAAALHDEWESPAAGASSTKIRQGPRKRAFKKKVLFLSNGIVGKSALIHRILYDMFDRGLPPTTGIDFLSKTVHINDHVVVRLQIWDTSGQERFRSLIPSCLLDDTSVADACAACIVYDITQRESFLATPELLRMARSALGTNASLLLVGTRADLAERRQVPPEEGEACAAEHGASFFEASAATGLNVGALFERLSAETAWRELGPEGLSAEGVGAPAQEEGTPRPLLAADEASPKSSGASLCRLAAELISGRCMPGKELWC